MSQKSVETHKTDNTKNKSKNGSNRRNANTDSIQGDVMPKDAFVQIRMANEEKTEWENQAKNKSKSMTQYVKDCVDETNAHDGIIDRVEKSLNQLLENFFENLEKKIDEMIDKKIKQFFEDQSNK